MKNKKINMYKSVINVVLVIILISILIFIIKNTYDKMVQKIKFENSIILFSKGNDETIFTINKILFFSSSDSKNKVSSSTNFTIQNLYTYTDIAIFIESNLKEEKLKSTLKNVKISNIKIEQEPLYGKPNIYYKSINDFAKSEFEEKNIIEKELEFEITSKDETDLSKPILYNNCANPITISYINQNIKSDYTMTDPENSITYNGSLLKRCGVSISSIQASISLDIEIENNENEKYKTTVYFDIPYENNEKSIYDGNIIERKNVQFNFYRYQ